MGTHRFCLSREEEVTHYYHYYTLFVYFTLSDIFRLSFLRVLPCSAPFFSSLTVSFHFALFSFLISLSFITQFYDCLFSLCSLFFLSTFDCLCFDYALSFLFASSNLSLLFLLSSLASDHLLSLSGVLY